MFIRIIELETGCCHCWMVELNLGDWKERLNWVRLLIRDDTIRLGTADDIVANSMDYKSESKLLSESFGIESKLKCSE